MLSIGYLDKDVVNVPQFTPTCSPDVLPLPPLRIELSQALQIWLPQITETPTLPRKLQTLNIFWDFRFSFLKSSPPSQISIGTSHRELEHSNLKHFFGLQIQFPQITPSPAPSALKLPIENFNIAETSPYTARFSPCPTLFFF